MTHLAVFGVRWWGGGTLSEVRVTAMLLIVARGVVVAGYQAFSEEVVFRGAVLMLRPASVSVPAAVVISMALFVLFHLPRRDASRFWELKP